MNPLPNHGNGEVHMIERDENWEACTKLSPGITRPLEQTVASLTLQECPKFRVLIPSPRVTKAVFRTLIPVPVVTQLVRQAAPDLERTVTVQAVMTQGMTHSGRCYTPEELAQNTAKKENNQKWAITEGEAEDLWQHMQPKDYSIIEHLKKTSAQILVLSLLASSPSHRHVLIKVLDDAHVPAGTNSEDLARLVAHVNREHKICFSKEELPVEGTSHNKALHIILECCDKAVGRVLVDNRSGLNIYPATTLATMQERFARGVNNK